MRKVKKAKGVPGKGPAKPPIKRRDSVARSLADQRYGPKVVSSARTYSRKGRSDAEKALKDMEDEG